MKYSFYMTSNNVVIEPITMSLLTAGKISRNLVVSRASIMLGNKLISLAPLEITTM
jgi:hypothetical protein